MTSSDPNAPQGTALSLLGAPQPPPGTFGQPGEWPIWVTDGHLLRSVECDLVFASPQRRCQREYGLLRLGIRRKACTCTAGASALFWTRPPWRKNANFQGGVQQGGRSVVASTRDPHRRHSNKGSATCAPLCLCRPLLVLGRRVVSFVTDSICPPCCRCRY